MFEIYCNCKIRIYWCVYSNEWCDLFIQKEQIQEGKG